MHKRDLNRYVGCGLYPLPQAARLVGVHVNTLRSWCGDRKGTPAAINRQFAKDAVLTFAELMELHFIKMFREEGVSLPVIRKAATAAERKFHTDHPFAVKRFDTDGKTIFATLTDKERDREFVEDLRHGQLVFETIIRPFFRKLDYRGQEEIERYWPLEKAGRVVLDPMRRFGQPVDAQTGISTQTITKAVNAGGGQDVATVAEWFDIPLEAVTAAITFERSLAT